MNQGSIPPKGSVSLDYFWECLACRQGGEGPSSNRDAEKHQRATIHPTRAWAFPISKRKESRDKDTHADGDSGSSAGPVPGKV